jgi:RNA polymerase sigma factor (sigma-70 family)
MQPSNTSSSTYYSARYSDGTVNYSFEEIYKSYFPVVEKYIRNNSGTRTDAEDIFQDAMLILIEKLRQDDFVLTATIQTYFFAIAKHLWLKRLKKSNKTTEYDDKYEPLFYENINSSIISEETYWDKLEYYMSKVTEHCNQLLRSIFFHQKTVEQIQTEFGYKDRHNMQNQKYKCLEQMLKFNSWA